ncbi:uncharacterized protein L203_104162 [Cryptococcus depauperatus CBS 7841]|uniref:JmjC domain-containing protein n=1 Tax=Cryptococcus depauperatus CBS 7841 TaxID=1295531 RepID=A0AAJ8JV64_9TREE
MIEKQSKLTPIQAVVNFYHQHSEGEGEKEDYSRMMELITSLQPGENEQNDKSIIRPGEEQETQGEAMATEEHDKKVMDANRPQRDITGSPLSDLPDLPDTFELSPANTKTSLPPASPQLSSIAEPRQAESSLTIEHLPPLPSYPSLPSSHHSHEAEPSQNSRKRPKVCREGTIKDMLKVEENDDQKKKRLKCGKNLRGVVDPTGTGRRVRGPEKVTTRGKIMSESQIRKLLLGKSHEFQLAPCQRPRYAKWGKCTQCISKLPGDCCRFRDYRVFPIDPHTTEIVGPGSFASTPSPPYVTPLPTKFSASFTVLHVSYIESIVAPLLLPLITSESRHIFSHGDVIKRGMDSSKQRSVCDFCSTTIFGGWWFCKKCGRDYCLQCERYFPDDMSHIKDSPWPLSDAARPRLLKCNYQSTPNAVRNGNKENRSFVEVSKRRGEKALVWHVRKDLQPVSRFGREELKGHWLDLSELVIHNVTGDLKKIVGETARKHVINAMGLTDDVEVKRVLNEWMNDTTMRCLANESESKIERNVEDSIKRLKDSICDVEEKVEPEAKQLSQTFRRATPELCPKLENTSRSISLYPWTISLPDLDSRYTFVKTTLLPSPFGSSLMDPIDPAGLQRQSQPFVLISTLALDNPTFHALWSRGEPIVVNELSSLMKEQWTPGRFAKQFEKQECSLVDCQTDCYMEGMVGEFFEMFGRRKVEEGKEQAVLKLNDWPPEDEFQSACPELYVDFCRALPVPDYTRRDGVLNLYSHFPPGPTRPDIGPKMYAAFAASELPGGFGSTRLHMDVADAVNIMFHAEPLPDGSLGCAVWDLYRVEDADKIRDFLINKFGKTHSFIDPIHSQTFYLDSQLRRELWDKMGVAGWRIYQYPGQAIFIPAGCAHQVCNLSDCIKIALDFVSPHNVSRCQKLSRDFRKENYLKAWKEDVLQLYNVLWYAWLSCREHCNHRQNVTETLSSSLPVYSHDITPTLSHDSSSLQQASQDPFSRSSLSYWSNDRKLLAPDCGDVGGLNGYGPVNGWRNVSSVRDEPPRGDLLPSKIANDTARHPDHDVELQGDSNLKQRASSETSPTRIKSWRQLANALFELTIKREESSPAEIFLPSTALILNRQGE